MFINQNDQIVEFDVDDTLVLWSHPNPDFSIGGVPCKIHKAHLESIKRFHARGQYVVVWSDGGWEWALQVVKALGLQNYVNEVRSKSKWHCDDKEASEWSSQRFYNSVDSEVKISDIVSVVYNTYPKGEENGI